jgi:DNA-binding LacI/PurR family transcriptional regulator
MEQHSARLAKFFRVCQQYERIVSIVKKAKTHPASESALFLVCWVLSAWKVWACYKQMFLETVALFSVPMGETGMATIKDVAARAGVSTSTVFYALSGKRPVSDEVRARVAKAVRELNYTASALGQRLRRGRSHTIGMVCPWPSSTSDWLVMELLSATAETASHAHHTLSVFMRQLSNDQVLNLVRNRVVDGLLIMQIKRRDTRIEALRQTNYPFVLIGRTANTTDLTLVDFDYDTACFAALEHLVELGHQHIGFIAPPSENESELGATIGYMVHIRRGFERARTTFGKARPDVQIYRQPSGPTIEDGYHAAEALLETHPEITAIFASYGSTHVGALHALHGRHLRVPEDCSVVGISTAQGAAWTIPRLTSVDVPLAEMGHTAAQLLLRKLGGEAITSQIVMSARVTPRESTAPPPTSLRLSSNTIRQEPLPTPSPPTGSQRKVSRDRKA